MAKTTVDIRTDENGYFCKTVLFDALGSPGSTTCLTVTLLSPFATGLWGSVAIEARDREPSGEERTFVIWHSETMQLEPWRLDGDENIIVLNGKTKPMRAHARLVLEIDEAT